MLWMPSTCGMVVLGISDSCHPSGKLLVSEKLGSDGIWSRQLYPREVGSSRLLRSSHHAEVT